jgi:hypothetical protein
VPRYTEIETRGHLWTKHSWQSYWPWLTKVAHFLPTWKEMHYQLDIIRVTRGFNVEVDYTTN